MINEELQKALSEILNKANNGIDSSGEFLAGELPEVISQLLLWHGVKSAAMCFFGVVFCVVWVWANKKQYDFAKENDLLNNPLMMFNVFQLPFVFIPLVAFNLVWLQIWIAPKIFLIEYAAKLAN